MGGGERKGLGERVRMMEKERIVYKERIGVGEGMKLTNASRKLINKCYLFLVQGVLVLVRPRLCAPVQGHQANVG